MHLTGLFSVLANVFGDGKDRVNRSQWNKDGEPLVCISEFSKKFLNVMFDMTKGHLGRREIVRALSVN